MKAPAYILRGEVIHGRGKGHTFGLPTANLRLENPSALPPEGVYAARISLCGKTFMGVTNIGTRPTLDHDPDVTVETYLLDFSGDLYGETLEVALYARLRDLQRFSDVQALRAQIRRDEAAARACFSQEHA